MRKISSRIRLDWTKVSRDNIDLIDSIEYENDDFKSISTLIRKYIKRSMPLDVLCKNWKQILQLGKDSSSLRSFVLRYGDTLGKELFESKCVKSTMTRDDYIEKYGYEEASRRLSLRGASLSNYIARHGIEAGTEKWRKYNEKRAASYATGRVQKRYASRNLAWFQKKHGEEKGFEVWDKKRKSQAYKVSRAYYIEQFGDIGVDMCRRTKTRSLEGFVKKYGHEEGYRRYEKWKYNVVASMTNQISVSKWALECCYALKQEFPDLIHFGTNEQIFYLPDEIAKMLGQQYIRPDLCYGNKIIEFNGDLFHGNPLLFSESDTPHPYDRSKTTAILREYDNIRNSYLRSIGYEVLEIWENDYCHSKMETIQQCINFLK